MTNSSTPRLRVAAIVVENDAILLVKHQKGDRSYWMLPGGGVDIGESLTDTLIRELKEEVCLDIQPQKLVLINDSIPPDHHRHIVNIYFTAKRLCGTPAVGQDKRIVDVAFIPINDLKNINLLPDFGDKLIKLIKQHFANAATYLGNLWKP